MDVLLDTHALLWLLNGDETIAETNKELLSKSGISKYISVASLWEIAIKTSIGKLEIEYPLEQLPALLAQLGFTLLAINAEHALAVAKLPYHHKDPFDRLLISQAMVEKLTLLTKDVNITKYEVAVAW